MVICLFYNNNRWDVGSINTSQLTLKNSTTLRANNPRLKPGSYKTQEDANILFAEEIDELIDRLDKVDGSTKPGLFLGLLDCTVADNEPDDPADNLTPGDYFIHDGATGPLWGVGEEIDDKNSIVWTGAIWEVLTSSNTLAQLGDVTLSSVIDEQILIYDGPTDTWRNQNAPYPKVTVGNAQPNDGSERKGDIFYNEDTSELFIYNDIWEKVSGGGSVELSANAPDPASEGDLWVETDNWTINVYDGYNWVGLTNSGLINGTDPTDYVLTSELNATVDSLEFVINQNKGTAESGLVAAIGALDATHLRMDPQGPLTGPLTLSDDAITAPKQAVTKEHVDSTFLKLAPQSALTTSLKFQRGEDKTGPQYKISLNGGTDYSTSIYSMQGGQMRFRTSHSASEGDHVGSHIILDPKGGIPETKIYHVVEPTDPKMAANKEYVDGLFGSSGVPVGSIMIWMNSSPPDGWFKLHGGTFDTATYPQLHAYLQSTTGYSSGVLPDWGGHYPGEYGDHIANNLGSKQGHKTAQPSGGAPKTSYDIPDASTRGFSPAGSTNAYSAGKARIPIGEGWDSVTRPPTVVVHYIIKHD